MKLPREMQYWLPTYILGRPLQWVARRTPKRVWVAICDHYEPLWRQASITTGNERVAKWRKTWPELAQQVGPDSRGMLPKYSFFYPQDEYQPQFLDPLAEMVDMALGDVEVHIHHDGEGRQKFIDKMADFCDALHTRHGLLRWIEGKLAFGFIHGNCALDNSRPDGKWCGLNDEIIILKELGCYADFTMPSAPSPTQARMVNEIYWATDDPTKPKSHDKGLPVRPGATATGDLLLITGPLGLRWRERLMPRLESGEIAANDPVTRQRVRRWFALAPVVGDDLFIKLHTHGTQEKNSKLLLDDKNLVQMFRWIAEEAKQRGADVCFASAFEMYQGVLNAAGLPAPNSTRSAVAAQ